jgi:hypothetical protein
VLERDFEFQNEKFSDKVLHFSLKIIVCEIFFYLKFEPEFFKLDDIAESVKVLVSFSNSVIQLNIEKKTQLVQNTLRLLCQMIIQISKQPDALARVREINAIPFI